MSKGLDKGESMLSKFGGKAAGLGAAAAGALGLSFAGALVLDAESAQAKLQVQLGGSAQYAADMGKIAGDLYAGAYGDSLGQVNEAIRGVVQSGAVMEDASNAEIQSVTKGVLNLSTAFDQDLGAATTAVGQIMRTGLADNAQEALDIITRGMQQGGDASGDLLDTFTEYPALFSRLGIDGATAMGLVNQGMANGARNSDLVADALKEFQIRATDGSKTSADAFKAMGLNAQTMTAQIAAGGPGAAAGLDTVLDRLRNMEDPVARNAAAVGIFGTQAEDLGAALFALDPTTAVAGLGQVGGAAAAMDKTLGDTAAGNLTSFGRTAQQIFTNVVGGQVLPVIKDVVGWVRDQLGPAFVVTAGFVSTTIVPAMQSLAQWVQANQTPLMIVAGIVTAVFLPALIQMGLQSLLAGAKTAAGWAIGNAAAIGGAAMQSVAVVRTVAGWVLMGAQAMLQAARMAAAWLIAMGPVGWVIAAVVGLVALIVANWDTVKRVTGIVWDWVVDKVKWVVDKVVAWFMNWTLPGLIIKHWSTIKKVFSAGVEAVAGFVGGLPGKIMGFFSSIGSWLYNAGKNLLQGLWNGISGAAGWLWSKISGWASGMLDKIKGFFGIGSPSKVFADYGGWLMEGMARGIASGANATVNAATAAAGRVGGALQVAPATAGIGVNGGRGAFGGTPGIRVYIGDRELTDIVRVETGTHVDRTLGGVADALRYAGA